MTLSTACRSLPILVIFSAVALGFPPTALALADGQTSMAAQVETPPADAVKTDSGLASKILRPGTGTVRPKSGSTVTVHYTGWTPDGRIFDSSVIKGQPATFALGDVIRGWSEGVQLMVAGEVRRLWIPGRLAYDGVDRPGAPKGPLVFEIGLIAIEGK